MESFINQQTNLHYENVKSFDDISSNQNCINNNHHLKNEIVGDGSFKKQANNDSLLSPSSYIIHSSDNEDDLNQTSSLDSSMVNTSILPQSPHPTTIYQVQPVIDLYQVPIYTNSATNSYVQSTNIYPSSIYTKPSFNPNSPQQVIINSTDNAHPYGNTPPVYYVVSPPQSYPVAYSISNNNNNIIISNNNNNNITNNNNNNNKKRNYDQIKSNNDEDIEDDGDDEEEEDEDGEDENDEGSEEEENSEDEQEMKSPQFTTPKKPIQNHHSTTTHSNSRTQPEPESNVTTPSLSSPSLPSPSPILSPASLTNLPLPFSGSTSSYSANNNKESVLYAQISEIQENYYRNLLKEHIPKMNQKDVDQSLVLLELYNLLVKCCNHPTLLTTQSQQVHQSNYIQSSGKLLHLEKIFDNISRSQQHTSNNSHNKVIILTYLDSVIPVLKEFLLLKRLSYYSNINSFYDNSNSYSSNNVIILISTFQNFNQYHLQHPNKPLNNSIIVEFDQFFDIQNMNSSIITQNYYKSMYTNTSDFNNNHIYRLVSFSTVEEWVYLFKSQNSVVNCNQLNIRNELIEMMKFCIVKMSNYKKPVIPSSNSSNTTPTLQPTTNTSQTGSPLALTPISVLANTMSTSNLWRSNSTSKSSQGESVSPLASQDFNNLKSTSTSTKCSSSPPIGEQSDQSQKKKKHRSPKKLKVQGERVCFCCKREEDCKGNTTFVQCRSCPMCYHRICVGLQNTPRSWKCIRHFCSQCKKTPNESGGSFFICKSCPLSYCITCLPDGVKILKKHEYVELKNKSNNNNSQEHDEPMPQTSVSDSNIPLHNSANTPQPIAEQKSSSFGNLQTKKPKIQRPIVYIECESCFQQQQSDINTNSASDLTTTSSKYKTLSETTNSNSFLNQNSSNLQLVQISPSSSFINSPPHTNSSVQSPASTSSPLLSDSPSTPSYYLSSDTSSDYLN